MSDILKAAAHPTVFPWLCLVFGLVVGSFLNVVIHRLPKMMERGWQVECADLRGEAIAPAERFNLFVPRSRCPACGHTVAAVENIPLVSWVMLRGRCSACKTRISPRYPLVELLGGAGAAWSAAHFGFGVAAFAAMVFLWCIVAASFIDFDTQLLTDSITLPLLWLGLLVNASTSSCESVHGRPDGRHRQRQERSRRAVRQTRGCRDRHRRDRSRAHAPGGRGDRGDTRCVRRKLDRRGRRTRSYRDAQARVRRCGGEKKTRGNPASAHTQGKRSPSRERAEPLRNSRGPAPGRGRRRPIALCASARGRLSRGAADRAGHAAKPRIGDRSAGHPCRAGDARAASRPSRRRDRQQRNTRGARTPGVESE